MPTGHVILLGAGPGDRDLLTVRAAWALQAADVIVFDRLALPPGFAEYVIQKAEHIDVGKKPGEHAISQDRINQILIEKAREGKTVVRLKGGDPFIFGRGGEEVLALLEAGISFEVIPGITAATAAGAYAGIPLTHRGLASCVTFVTGHEDPTKEESDLNYDALAKTGGTLVFYMGVKRLAEIAARLIEAGLAPDTPAACVANASMVTQRTVRGTLADIAMKVAEGGIEAPAITIVGKVAGLPEALGWYERLPLLGKRVLITRAENPGSSFKRDLERLGAKTVFLPTIEIVDPPSWEPVDAAVSESDRFDWIVFTSANAVGKYISRLRYAPSPPHPSKARFAVVGKATAAELARFVRRLDLTPDDFSSAGLLQAFREKVDLGGKRVLMPRSHIARPELIEGLIALGAEVTEVVVYVTRTNTDPDPETVERVRRGECDIVTFTSSSTVTGFVEIIGRESVQALGNSVAFASIGPMTSATCRELGVPVSVEAVEHTTDGLVRAILDSASRD